MTRPGPEAALSEAAPGPVAATAVHDVRTSYLRWAVLVLVFAASTINYVDRQIIALLKPDLQLAFRWSDQDYANIVSAFQLATAASFPFAGWFVDRVGLRTGYAVGVGAWSLAATLHAGVRTVLQFSGLRMILGAAETINTPAGLKAVSASFSEKERSLAIGVMAVAPNFGAVMTPLLIPGLALAFGWRGAFAVTGAVGGVWLLIWLLAPKAMSAPRIASGSAGPAHVPWARLLTDRSTWAVAIAKLLTDQVWWFLLFWTPDFFHRRYGLSTAELAVPLACVYAMAGTGALYGGLLPTRLLARGLSLNVARKAPLVLGAIIALPLPLLLYTHNLWTAVAMLGLILAAHQVVSANIFALCADRFPVQAVGSVIGIGALFGNLSGLAMLEFTGWVLSRTQSYMPMFLICAGAYAVAFVAVQLLVPNVVARTRLHAKTADGGV
ncbi:MAG: MFS transporter [Caulobacteraceae bacterium]